MNKKKSSSQLDFPAWKPTVGWFHIFRTMIESGDAAKMKGTAFLVYAVIKSHINPTKGIGFPSLETIANKAGCTVKTVRASIEKLEELGYLRRKTVDGKPSQYSLIEKVQFDGMDETGKQVPMQANFDYVPVAVNKAVQDIKNVMVSGALPQGSVVHIENLSINMQVLPQALEAHQYNLGDITNPEIRDAVRRAMQAQKANKLDE